MKLRKRKEPKPLRTQCQVLNETKTRKNQKCIKTENAEIQVNPYPEVKIKQKLRKLEVDICCPSFRQRSWIEFDKGYSCCICELFVIKQKHQIDKKVFRREKIRRANKMIRKVCFSMVNMKFKTTEDVIRIYNL